MPVTTPQEFWPITGLFRLLGFALGDKRLFGPGGPAWPDEPWWKLTGLFDLTGNQSLRKGADQLEAAIAANENVHRVIYAISQGAGVANVVKSRLAVQYAGFEGPVPDIDFVLSGDPNLPNGGLMSRFPDLYIPILDLLFNGPAATDTPFDTVEIARQYDGFTDFTLYPINLLADLNAILGVLYVHSQLFDVSLPAEDPTTSPAFRGVHGDTSYYVFDNPDLPLFGPLRTLGVPEPIIDIVEPVFRVLAELGYDRSIPPWEPTPARVIPRFDPVKLIVDLVGAVGEGINNALAVVGLPPLLKISHPVTPAPRTDGETHSGPPQQPRTSTRVDVADQRAPSTVERQHTRRRQQPSASRPPVEVDEKPVKTTANTSLSSPADTPRSPTSRRSVRSSHPESDGARRKRYSGEDADLTPVAKQGAEPDGSRTPAGSAEDGGTRMSNPSPRDDHPAAEHAGD
ncbi:PE-PPE domain-containing protein [Mycolicibacterium vaccae]|uniref:PE-PPE domain-containing protein n=1 Tax=Mycolicibacterium vaccae TaxID=1810 RepID=UPI003CEF99D1